MDRERLDKWCASTVLGLVLAILVYSALATGAVRLFDFAVVQWLTVALIVVWGIRFWINPDHRLLWSPVCWAVLAFVGYAVARYWTADIEYVARMELTRVIVYAVVFYAVVTNLHRQDSTQVVALTLIIVATGVAMYAAVQFLTESDRVWNFVRPEIYRRRGSGTFICPNHLAGYLEMILPLAVTFTLTGRFSHVTKVLAGYCSLVIFAGIAVSVSRGGWLASCLSLMVLFFWLLRQRDYRLQAGILLAALVAIAAVFVVKVQFSYGRQKQLAEALRMEDWRFMLWDPAMRMWQDHPLWGVGPGHFDHRFREYRPARWELQGRPDRVHNDYLNTLVDWGAVGGVLMLGVWGLFYWNTFRSWPYVQRAPNDLTTKRSNKTSLVLGASLGLLAILFHSFVDFNLHIPANALVAATLMALVAGHFRFATERYWITLHTPLRLLASLVLLAAVVFLGQQSWKRSIEAFWLVKAAAAPYASTAQMYALEKASTAENKNAETAYELGEAYRAEIWQAEMRRDESAGKAMEWFARSMALNPYDPYPWLRYGMCLHWLGRHAEAASYFRRAQQLDPNGHQTLALVGWHYVQQAEANQETRDKIEDYRAAQKFFQESLYLNNHNNPMAYSYLGIVSRRLADLTANARS